MIISLDKNAVFPLNEDIEIFAYARIALLEGLKRLGLEPGDIVFLPELICNVVLAPIARQGLKIKYYPVDKRLHPCWEFIEQNWHDRVKAILVVNYFGFPCGIEESVAFTKKKNVFLIEDNAHGFLSQSDGRPLGSFGDLSIFSFRKTLPMPNGGALVMNNQQLKKARVGKVSLKAYRSDVKYYIKYALRHCGLLPKEKPVLQPPAGDRMQEFDCEDQMIELAGSSQWLLRHFCFKKMMAERRNRFYEWVDFFDKNDIGAQPVFRTLPESVVPQIFPVYADNMEDLLSDLYKKGFFIYCWPFLPEALANKQIERIACLPVVA